LETVGVWLIEAWVPNGLKWVGVFSPTHSKNCVLYSVENEIATTRNGSWQRSLKPGNQEGVPGMNCSTEIRNTETTEEGCTATQHSFDCLHFPRLPQLNYWMDGKPGKRTVFIESPKDNVLISFEEGMRCIDLAQRAPDRRFEYRREKRYLHQTRSGKSERNTTGSWSFFHMEITDPAGNIHWLPGQMVAWAGYPWAEGVEPLLVEILNSISIC